MGGTRDVPSFRLSEGGRIRRESKRAADEPPGVENVAALVRHPVAVVLVREDDLTRAPRVRNIKETKGGAEKQNDTHTCRQGIEAHGVVVLGLYGQYVRRERSEVTLVEDRLDELRRGEAGGQF